MSILAKDWKAQMPQMPTIKKVDDDYAQIGNDIVKFRATAELRWMQTRNSWGDVVQMLQQKWIAATTPYDSTAASMDDWRDVPLVIKED